MSKMTIKVILKSGLEFAVRCDKFTIEKNIVGQITRYEVEGIAENEPVYLNLEEVAAIVRVLSDE